MGWKSTLGTLRWAVRAPRQRWRHLRSGQIDLATVFLHPTTDIVGSGDFHLGAGAAVGRHAVMVAGPGCTLEIGEGAWIGNDCEIDAAPSVRIGARTSLQHRSQILGSVQLGAGCVCAANLYISSGMHRFADTAHLPVRVQDFRARQASDRAASTVVVGDDCWFGINVVVLPGVTIGRGCVIGANSVVRSDLPPYSIAVGSPARVVKSRLNFDPPAAIDASRDDHIPYFYSGLRQLARTEAGDKSCPRVRDGWPTVPAFSLALQASAGDRAELQIDALCGGQLIHGDHRMSVHPGRQTACFPVHQGRWGQLHFNWHSGNAGIADALVVLSAKITRGEAA